MRTAKVYDTSLIRLADHGLATPVIRIIYLPIYNINLKVYKKIKYRFFSEFFNEDEVSILGSTYNLGNYSYMSFINISILHGG
jgi:hypothetical protein